MRSSLKKFLITSASFGLLLVILGLVFSQAKTHGDASIDNTNGNWQGTLGAGLPGPVNWGNDVSQANINNVVIAASPANDGTYNVALTSIATSGNLMSADIVPSSLYFTSWKQVLVSVIYPQGGSSSTLTFNVLCGDSGNCAGGSITYHNAIPGYSNIDPSSTNGVIDISGISTTYPSLQKITLQAVWGRQNTNTTSVTLVKWSVTWKTHSNTSLYINHSTATGGPANPAIYANPPGASNNSTVTYSITYATDQNIGNAVITVPFPTGLYQGRSYSVTYKGSSGGSQSGTNVIFNLGNISAGIIGTVSITFQVNTGPPDGTILMTTANLSGNSGSLSVNSLQDQLNLQSQAYLYPLVKGPSYLVQNTNVTYFMKTDAGGVNYQADVFNADWQFSYPSCETYDTSKINYTQPSGLAVPTIDTINRLIIFHTGNYYFYPPEKYFTVTLGVNSSCANGTSVPVSLTLITADKISTFHENKTASWSSTIDPNQHFGISKSTWGTPTGAGLSIGYNLKFVLDSNLPLNNFYAVDQVPANTLFISADINPGYLTTSGISPNSSNPWNIYTSNASRTGPIPPKGDPSWVLLNLDGTSTYGTNTNWVKYQVNGNNSFYWDNLTNGEWPLGHLNVYVVNPLPSGVTSITNTITGYTTSTCNSPSCTLTTVYTIPANNQPYYVATSYFVSPNPTNSGSNATFFGYVANSWDSNGTTTADGYNNVITMRVPNSIYLDPTTPIVSATAFCLTGTFTTNCPDATGTVQTNPSWLTGTYNAAAGSVTWNIPLIYSQSDYPPVSCPGQAGPNCQPYEYQFKVVVKTKIGQTDQTVAGCSGGCTITASGQNNSSPPTVVAPRSWTIYQNLVIVASSDIIVTKCCNTLVPSGQSVTYTFNYSNPSPPATGSPQAVYIKDPIPQNSSVNPAARMTFVSASAPNGESLYYMVNYPRDSTAPAANSPNWIPFPVPAGQQASVDWVMWKIPYVGLNTKYTVSLTTQDPGTSNALTYTNVATYTLLSGGVESAPLFSDPAVSTISNPGYITTKYGDIGSVNGISFQKPTGTFVGLDATSSAINDGASTSFSWSHPVNGTLANRYLLVGISIRGGCTVTGVTDNGVAGSMGSGPIVNVSNGSNAHVEFWGMLAPPGGSNTIAVTLSSSGCGIVAGASSWFNVNQTTPISYSNTNYAYSNNPTVNMISSLGEAVVDLLSMPNVAGDISTYNEAPNLPQATLWESVATNTATLGGSSFQPGQPSITNSWNTKWENWAYAAVSIQPPRTALSTVDYAALAQTISTCCLTSAKNWLISGYPLNTKQIKYADLWNIYGGNAVPCNTVSSAVNNCLDGTQSVRVYDASKVGSSLVIDTNTLYNPYNSNPLIFFVKGLPAIDSGTALHFNTNFTIPSTGTSGIIFVVSGDVKIDPGVTEVDGAFLVDGQFATGSLGTSTVTSGTGKYSSILIGRDSFPRIVYTAGTDVRYIRCFDINCNQRAYNFLGTVGSVSSINFVFDSSGATDIPRIVVGADTSGVSKTFYIYCSDQDCTNHSLVPLFSAGQGGTDPDIVLDSSNQPNISEGYSTTGASPFGVNYIVCTDASHTCSSQTNTPVSAATGSYYPGNDTQIALDSGIPVITFANRFGGQSDLYMARLHTSGAKNSCSNTNWDCYLMSPSPQGNVGQFPSMGLYTSFPRVSYNDLSQGAMQYLQCSASACTNSNTTTTNIDCPGGNVCNAQKYSSMVLNSSGLPRVVYNIKEKALVNGNSVYNVRFNYCNSNCTVSTSWLSTGLSLESGDVQSPGGGIPGVQAFTQALGLGTDSNDTVNPTAVDHPRIVYFNANTGDLRYIRCISTDCTNRAATTVLDHGSPITLKDQPLTVKGLVIAYGNSLSGSSEIAILLQRDMFTSSTTIPGENFYYEPRYYYLFKGILKYVTPTQEVKP